MDDEFNAALEFSAALAAAHPAEIYGRNTDDVIARMIKFVREMPIDKNAQDGESLVRIDVATVLVHWARLQGHKIPEDIREIGKSDEESAYVALVRLFEDGKGPYVDAHEILY